MIQFCQYCIENMFVPSLFYFSEGNVCTCQSRQCSQSIFPVTNSFVMSILMQAESQKMKFMAGLLPCWKQILAPLHILWIVFQMGFAKAISASHLTLVILFQDHFNLSSETFKNWQCVSTLALCLLSWMSQRKWEFSNWYNNKLKLQDNTLWFCKLYVLFA